MGGYKTGSTWSMFSNLRTHGELNHVFFRIRPCCSWSSDLVTITASTAASIRDYHATFDLRDPPDMDLDSAYQAGFGSYSQETNDLKQAVASFAKRNLDDGGCIIYSNSTLGIKRKTTVRPPPYRVAFWQLRSLVAEEMLERATFSLSYERDAAKYQVEVKNGELFSGDAAVTEAPPFILRKIVWFRSLPVTDVGGGTNAVP